MRIYLVGYMYSGKTTLGRQLAELLGLTFVDTDQLFEQHYRVSIAQFFQRYDEALFRKLESQELRATLQYDHHLIATGGGTPCHDDNMQWMKQHGLVVYLHVTPEQVLARLAKSRHPRPLLMQLTERERLPYIEQQLAQRIPYYQLAHLHADGFNPDISALQSAIQSALQ